MNTVTREEMPWGWRVSIYEPRLLVSKNDALEMKFLDGYRNATGVRRYKYNEAARRVREVVALAARPIGPLVGLVDVQVSLCPVAAWDDDAGIIVATWVVDGLVDARLWPKDRRAIRWLSVRTVRNVSEAAIVLEVERVPS